jgi:hypothetical protein
MFRLAALRSTVERAVRSVAFTLAMVAWAACGGGSEDTRGQDTSAAVGEEADAGADAAACQAVCEKQRSCPSTGTNDAGCIRVCGGLPEACVRCLTAGCFEDCVAECG